MWDFITTMMPFALAATAPMLVVALGGLFSERSGIINIGLEGLMVIGAFTTSFFVSQAFAGNMSTVWLGILLGGVAGCLVSLLHAYASISLKANQVISGTAINLLAPALTLFLAQTFTGGQNVRIPTGVPRYDIPYLSKIPILGPLFFTRVFTTTLIAFAIVAITWYLVFKTAFGLRLRACGEHPQAADSMGINVYRMRYIGVLASGFLSGLGGAILLVTASLEANGEVAGLGFLALAALIFGKWNPVGVMFASFFFGFMRTLGSLATINPTLLQWNLPVELYNALPYLMTLIALMLFSRNASGPRAAGEAYDKGKR
ncbi:MAG: ABC transporter permease [Turicibacter sp.]|nr:ABC transporter permease [Turicibacter sp.]